MIVWSICVSISVTITDIWTKFGTEHKYHTTNTQEWPNSYKLKIQDGGGHHLKFRKNVGNFGLDKDILHQIIWEDAARRRGDDHVTKSRKRTWRHQMKVWSKCAAHPNKSEMAAAAIFNFGKISITPDWIKIYAPNFMKRCIETMQRWSHDQKSKPEVNSRDVIKWRSEV